MIKRTVQEWANLLGATIIREENGTVMHKVWEDETDGIGIEDVKLVPCASLCSALISDYKEYCKIPWREADVKPQKVLTYPREMEVSDFENFDSRFIATVISENNGMFWYTNEPKLYSAAGGVNSIKICPIKFAREINSVKQITMAEIEKWVGCKVEIVG